MQRNHLVGWTLCLGTANGGSVPRAEVGISTRVRLRVREQSLRFSNGLPVVRIGSYDQLSKQ